MEPQFSSQFELGKARAKINLTLHVGQSITAGRYDGYHPLDSFVVFADVGDQLSYETDENDLSLSLSGAFSAGLKAEDDNLILKAARTFFTYKKIAPQGHFHLEKNLPLASGIGGGSADAAAALRLLQAAYGADGLDMMSICEKIGADVPVCFLSQTSHMRGIGEDVEVKSGMGSIAALLVNPGFAVSTARIFKAFDAAPKKKDPRPQTWCGDLLKTTSFGRNDLQDIAMFLRPEIKELIGKLAHLPQSKLARMSGSGATCFALFETQEQARAAKDIICRDHPDYWCIETILGGLS
ncbi:MAG: 4-(cytidine 5'-diphospho)-2-C-methyl-D-erythritol kinase [Maricaulaceae bacterium]